MNDDPAEAAAIWAVIDAQHRAFWLQDFEAFARCHLQHPDLRYWFRLEGAGLTRRNGWQSLSDAFHRQVAGQRPRPDFAYEARRENAVLRIGTDMAWAAYDMVYPTAMLAGFRGPDRAHDMRVLEKHDGQWLIAMQAFFDEQWGQHSAPSWQVDASGRVVRQNPAATAHLEGESDAEIRAGRLRMRDRATDRRLAEALREAAIEPGFASMHYARSVVVDPGSDEPARVWWVVAESGTITVSFNDPWLVAQRLRSAGEAFGLSPAQLRFAESVVEGLSLPDAAAREGIRPSTARTHLQRVFDKVGVRTQPALVRALLAVAEPGRVPTKR